jgi:hypothetical protein
MLALIAWQAATFFALVRVTRSHSLAWAGAALPVALAWPWNGWAGSMADFRLDHFAMCAFGISFAAALLADGFRSTRWSIAFGAAVGFTLLTRFLTGTYFTLIFLACLTWLLCTQDRWRRVRNLGLAALTAFGLAAPIFWLNREWVWNYYWIGHFTGPESAIRSPHMNFSRSLNFVWSNVRDRHLGAMFGWATGLASALWVFYAVIAWWPWTRDPAKRATGKFFWTEANLDRGTPPPASRPQAPLPWSMLRLSAIFMLAPATVLTLHSQKSEIVLGVILPGLIGLIVFFWLVLLRFVGAHTPPTLLRNLAAIPTLVVCTLTTWHFHRAVEAPPHDSERTSDLRAINQLADRVFTSVNLAKLTRPWVGVNQISTGFDALVLSVICYERHKVWVPFAMTLPTGIMEADEKLIMERVALSDFFFLVVDGPVSDWPFDRQQRALLPKVQAWCEANRRPVARYEIFGQRMVLYQRPEIPFASGRP